MKKLMKKQKGITLIALVVTIIVLLILAGISIMMLTGQSGILNQARAAKEDTRGGEVKDEVALAVSENTMADYTGNGTRKSRQEVIDQLHKEGKLTDDEVTWLEEYDQITIGSIEIDFSNLGETTEGIEDMYYLVGDYNDETKQIENIELGFIEEVWPKIVEEYPDKFTMTEDELVFNAQSWRDETAKDFDDLMEKLYKSGEIEEQYTTAKEFCMGYMGCPSEEEYNSYIKELKVDLVEIDDSLGKIMSNYNDNYYVGKSLIEGIGEYKFTIKINGKEIDKITVKVEQYEIISASGNIENEHYISGIVAYDFINKEILKIDSGEYNYIKWNGEEGSNILTSEDIKTIEGIGSFIKKIYDNGIYTYKLKNNNITVNGYYLCLMK